MVPQSSTDKKSELTVKFVNKIVLPVQKDNSYGKTKRPAWTESVHSEPKKNKEPKKPLWDVRP